MPDDFGPIQEEYRLAYQANIELAIQQTQSELSRAFVPHSGLSGRSVKMIDIVGETQARVNPPRGGDTPDMDGATEQAWLRPICIDWGKTIETEDDIKAAVSYQSAYVQSGGAAIVRGQDQVRAQSIFGDRLTGQDGTTVTPWDNTGRLVAKTVGSVDGSTNVGMNVKKILRGLRLLEEMKVNVDTTPIWMTIDPEENEDLYNDLQFVSKDYRDKAVIEERRVRSILGVTFLPTTWVPDYDATTSRCAMWVTGALHEGTFQAVTTSIGRNPAKRYRPHPYIETWMGATRGESKRLIEIRNQKAA